MWARLYWKLDVGAKTQVHPAALLDHTWPVGLHIGTNCVIGANAVILTHDYTRGILTDTHIGNHCRIGERAMIMPGLTIGDGCVVCPGAIVTRSMPACHYASGNPATISLIADLPGFDG